MSDLKARNDVIERVIILAAEQAGLDAGAVTAEMRLEEDLDFDSLDKVEFTMTMEDAFDLSIPDELAEDVTTVGQAAELVIAALAGAVRVS